MDVAKIDPSTILAANGAAVRARIAAACARVGRDPAGVRLVAVTKSVGLERIRELAALGQLDLAENRVQQAAERIPHCPPGITWHLIGHLQSNKARPAAELFAVIHSVDSPRLAQRLEAEAARLGRTLAIYLQVNVAGEAQKSGCAPADSPALLAAARACPHLALAGLMTLAPLADDPEAARPAFRALRRLRDELNRSLPAGAPPLAGLSMGMSSDFEVAIEEGATVVRVGTALYAGLLETAAPAPAAASQDFAR
ncbi:MAG: YggS family pyridoxal phosphate-dependent enzyme [Planctomycetes bacterium]|nr:YggS family pyridoxal phosphate-dependent enzyme [Planctomycetota bacterium]